MGCTLHVDLEIDFDTEPTQKLETKVLKELHKTLKVLKQVKWIYDYKLKGGKV